MLCDLIYVVSIGHYFRRYLTALSSYFSGIKTLIESNYKNWIHDVELVIGLIDLDMCLREDKHVVSFDDSSSVLRQTLKNKKGHTL